MNQKKEFVKIIFHYKWLTSWLRTCPYGHVQPSYVIPQSCHEFILSHVLGHDEAFVE